MSLLKIPMPRPGEMMREHVDMLIATVNALVDTSSAQDGINIDVTEAVKILIDRLNGLEHELQANLGKQQSSFDFERSHFILQLHSQKLISRDEARQMLGLPDGERRNPAPFTKEDLEIVAGDLEKYTDKQVLDETLRRLQDDPQTQEVLANLRAQFADAKQEDCLEKAIEDGELPVDIGAGE